MEEMRQCPECRGWVRSYSPSSCTCDPPKTLKPTTPPTPEQQAKIDEMRAYEEDVRQRYGDTAKVVSPYKPNRKQKRAQAAASCKKNRRK